MKSWKQAICSILAITLTVGGLGMHGPVYAEDDDEPPFEGVPCSSYSYEPGGKIVCTGFRPLFGGVADANRIGFRMRDGGNEGRFREPVETAALPAEVDACLYGPLFSVEKTPQAARDALALTIARQRTATYGDRVGLSGQAFTVRYGDGSSDSYRIHTAGPFLTLSLRWIGMSTPTKTTGCGMIGKG